MSGAVHKGFFATGNPPADIADAIEAAGAQAEAMERDNVNPGIPRVPRKALSDFKRDTDGRNVLIKGRWGVRGSISMHISTTGSGKSVLQTQSALCFNRGVSCCGLEPTRPFRTWVIQSEDDDDRVAIDRDDIAAYLAKRYPMQDWNAAMRETAFLDFTGVTGVSFVETLNNELNAVKNMPTEKPDAIIINPWNKFFGGDPMSHKDCSAFLAGGELGRGKTEGIEAVLKRHNVWLWVFSHTGKPPTSKELKDWLNDPYSCYKMCGSSAVPDAVRSIITFLKVPDRDGVFTFTAGKNGSGLGWTDANGNRTARAFFQWGEEERHYWRDVEKSMCADMWDASAAAKPTKPTPPTRDEIPLVLDALAPFDKPLTKGTAVAEIRRVIDADRAKADPPVKNIGRNDATSLLEIAIAKGCVMAVEYGGREGTLCGLPGVMQKWREQTLPGLDAGDKTEPPVKKKKRGAR